MLCLSLFYFVFWRVIQIKLNCVADIVFVVEGFLVESDPFHNFSAIQWKTKSNNKIDVVDDKTIQRKIHR